MNQIVVAVFEGQSSANAAVDDLEVANIPSVVIKRYAAADPEERITPTGFEVCRRQNRTCFRNSTTSRSRGRVGLQAVAASVHHGF